MEGTEHKEQEQVARTNSERKQQIANVSVEQRDAAETEAAVGDAATTKSEVESTFHDGTKPSQPQQCTVDINDNSKGDGKQIRSGHEDVTEDSKDTKHTEKGKKHEKKHDTERSRHSRHSHSRSRSRSRHYHSKRRHSHASRSKSRSRSRSVHRKSHSRHTHRDKYRSRSRSRSRSKHSHKHSKRDHHFHKSKERSSSSSSSHSSSPTPQESAQQKPISETVQKVHRGGWDDAPTLSSVQALIQPIVDTRPRVYIGNINFNIEEAQIRELFSRFGQIKALNMPRGPTGQHRGFCFIDYSHPHCVDLAIKTMNGLLIGGRQIKVGLPATTQSRPASATVSVDIPQIEIKPLTAINPVNDCVLYVGSIPWQVSAQDIRALFLSFGQIIDCQLAPNKEAGGHKGFGFVEFSSPDAARQAAMQLNGYILNGRQIKVGPAATNLRDEISAANKLCGVASCASVGVAANTVVNTVAEEENLTVKSNSQRAMIMKRMLDSSVSGTTVLSCVVLLENMVDDVDENLESEVREECQKFGSVVSVVIKKFGSRVRIFVRFSLPDASKHAVDKLDQRYFGGRQIKATLYDEKAFSENNYYL